MIVDNDFKRLMLIESGEIINKRKTPKKGVLSKQRDFRSYATCK